MQKRRQETNPLPEPEDSSLEFLNREVKAALQSVVWGNGISKRKLDGWFNQTRGVYSGIDPAHQEGFIKNIKSKILVLDSVIERAEKNPETIENYLFEMNAKRRELINQLVQLFMEFDPNVSQELLSLGRRRRTFPIRNFYRKNLRQLFNLESINELKGLLKNVGNDMFSSLMSKVD